MRCKNKLTDYVVDDYFYGSTPEEELLASRPLPPAAYNDLTDVVRERSVHLCHGCSANPDKPIIDDAKL